MSIKTKGINESQNTSCARRVLMVGSCLQEKGGIASVLNIYTDYGLLKDKYFVPSHRKGPILQRLAIYMLCLIRVLRHLFFNLKIKIIHVHVSQRGSFFRKSIIIILAKLFGKRTIFHLHGSEFALFYKRSPSVIRRFIRGILDHCDAIIVLSESWKKILNEITDNPNIWVIYNPAIIAKNEKVFTLPCKLKPNFVFLGNIGRRKGIYDLLEAVNQLKETNFTISVFGDGEVEQAKKLVNELCIHETVKIHGWISGTEKKRVLEQSHALLLPSYNEGLPVSILEALAMGIPILSTSVGGIPEAVEDGLNGFLIQPGDIEMLKYRLVEMANSPELLRKMSISAYRVAKEKFDYKVIFSRLNEVYLNILAI